MTRVKDDQVHKLADTSGLDKDKLREMISLNLTEVNLNEFGRFDALKKTVNKKKDKEYFEDIEKIELTQLKVNQKTLKLLHSFILQGGFDIDTISSKGE